ncbi:MAG: hypothetical protein GX131_03115 [candidate division WS1 bacterium]|nr:hypothetical protein [candidate division WS1 bacterium]
MRKVILPVMLLMACSMVLDVHAAGPWSLIMPDPDEVDWSSTNRPGYHYRGMLPVHERFYEYIQSKRAQGQELSMADNAMIRRLQAARRWPEAPVPNEFWKSFLRYLREQPTLNLNFAQGFMVSEALARGLIPMDLPQNPDIRKAVEYLNSGPFRARNWFERCFGRVEPWMDYYAASRSLDMTDGGGAPSGVFPPGGDFNGLRINYNITGVKLGAPTDTEGFVTKRSYTGTVGPGTVTISGSGSINKGWGAKLEVYLRIGKQEIEEEFSFDSPGSKDFSYTVQIPADTDFTFPAPQFWIRLTGLYSTAGAGSAQVTRGLLVSGRMEGDPNAIAAQRERADAEWRAEVERTLRELGYEQTPAGRELEAMRAAIDGGDATWKAYVDRKQRELGYQDATPEAGFDEMARALEAGGPTWQQFAAAHGGGGTPPVDAAPPTAAPPATTPPPTPPATGDIGGLMVGTGTDGSTTTGVADHFPRANKIAAALTYQNIPQGSMAVAVWTRDGAEVTRGNREIGGNGWVSFSIFTEDAAGLQPGRYTLTISVGDRILGRKSFTIGGGAG